MDTKTQIYYTTEDIADLLKVNKESVRRWVRDNKFKAGKFIRTSHGDLDVFFKNTRGLNYA